VIDSRQVRIEDRHGTRLPFSKGILAASMMATGIDPEEAHRLAVEVEDELGSLGHSIVGVDELSKLTESTIERRLGADPARTWATWIQARRAAMPIVVFIGGATGVGKSTVATRVAAQVGITRVVASDAIREVMRGTSPPMLAPILHVSSFEAHRELRAPVPSEHDAVVEGFRQQAELVAVGARMLVDRAITERTDLILEGAHLVPGLFDSEWERWSGEVAVCQVVLSVADPETHRAHFLARLDRTRARRPDRYLEQFDEIRRIQRYVVQQAAKHGVPVVEVDSIDDAILGVRELVVSAVTAGPASLHP
jgi:2-phosphoglycerate kinase